MLLLDFHVPEHISDVGQTMINYCTAKPMVTKVNIDSKQKVVALLTSGFKNICNDRNE